MTTTTASRMNAEQFAFLTEAVTTSAALDTADRLGILNRLEQGPVDAPTLAHDCAIGERGARWLLAALATLGVAATDGNGTYYAAVPRIGRLGRFITLWDGLSQVVREDRSVAEVDTPAGAQDLYSDAVAYLGIAFQRDAQCVADYLSPFGKRVLDVGAGAAPWSIALAQRDPECCVTAVDLPAVLEVTKKAVAAAGVKGTYDYLGGDFFALDLGDQAYDLAILGNICHLFDETNNCRLLTRLFEVIQPGGKIAIVEPLPNERLDGPREVILYGLGLLLRTSTGQAYPLSTFTSWLQYSGYESIERFELSSFNGLSLITGRRP